MPHKVGVPLTVGWVNKRNKGPAHMEIEQWPIVQTFGLSELNLGGFFTMKHPVVDVTPSLASLWRHIDARCFETTTTDSMRSMKRHWWEAMRVIGSKPVQKRRNVSEGMVADPLLSWYEFGRIRMEDDAKDRSPCVRFGIRTSSQPTSDEDDATLLEAVWRCMQVSPQSFRVSECLSGLPRRHGFAHDDESDGSNHSVACVPDLLFPELGFAASFPHENRGFDELTYQRPHAV